MTLVHKNALIWPNLFMNALLVSLMVVISSFLALATTFRTLIDEVLWPTIPVLLPDISIARLQVSF